MALTRRESKDRNILGRVPADSDKPPFLGYHDPTAGKDFAELDDQSKARYIIEMGSSQEHAAMDLTAKIAVPASQSEFNPIPDTLLGILAESNSTLSTNDAFELYTMTADVMEEQVSGLGGTRQADFTTCMTTFPDDSGGFRRIVQDFEQPFQAA
jgi:hypothetical protein